MPIPYDHYRIFYHVAKYHSFTRAAAVLMNSQPNITRTMNELERQLGCRLFLRSNRGVTLTPEGERLYAHVAAAVEQLQAGEAELAGGRGLAEGRVAVGTSELGLYGLLLPVLRQFRKLHPGVSVRVTNQTTGQSVAAVKSGAVDLAVVAAPTGASRPLSETPLVEFRDILAAGPRFRHLAQGVHSLRELAELPFVSIGPETQTFRFYDGLFARYGLALQPEVETATTDQILPMLRSDLGLGLLPEGFAREALEKGEVFRVMLEEELPPRYICLVKDRSRPLSMAALELERMLCAAGRAQGRWG